MKRILLRRDAGRVLARAAGAPPHRRPAADRVPARSGPDRPRPGRHRQRSKPPQRRSAGRASPAPPTATTAPSHDARRRPKSRRRATPEPPTATPRADADPHAGRDDGAASAERDGQLPGPRHGCAARRQGVAHGHDHGRRGRPRGEPGRHLLDPARPVGRHARPRPRSHQPGRLSTASRRSIRAAVPRWSARSSRTCSGCRPSTGCGSSRRAWSRWWTRSAGVDITLNCPLHEITPDPKKPNQFVKFDLPAGKNHLDGAAAKKFATYRYNSNDFYRGQRQQQLIWAIKEQAHPARRDHQAAAALDRAAAHLRDRPGHPRRDPAGSPRREPEARADPRADLQHRRRSSTRRSARRRCSRSATRRC